MRATARCRLRGVSVIGELRKLARTRPTDDALHGIISQAAAEIVAFRGWLTPEAVCERIRTAKHQ